MAEGWLLSEGEVLASASEEAGRLASLLLCRHAGQQGCALVASAPRLVLGDPKAELAFVDADGLVVDLLEPSRRPRRRRRSAVVAVAAPSGLLRGAGVTEGCQLEFRSSK